MTSVFIIVDYFYHVSLFFFMNQELTSYTRIYNGFVKYQNNEKEREREREREKIQEKTALQFKNEEKEEQS